MPTANGDTLTYGQDALIPTGARAAWGTRLIVTQDGLVDLVLDRMGAAGEDRTTFMDQLTATFPPDKMMRAIRELLEHGEMNTRVAKDFTLLDRDGLEVHANTNSSGGYCYVTAWAQPKED